MRSALTSCINVARGAIGDNGEAQRLIKTLPRKGLRFVGDVHEDHSSGDPSQSALSARKGIALSELPLTSVSPRVPDKPSIAVLPFTNMSDTWVTVPADPEPGAGSASPGIYDVKSGSQDLALDGIRYGDWE